MTDTTTPSDDRSHVILVTGVSGAGKSSALKDFEDLGFEAVDNLPLSLFDRLLASGDVPGGGWPSGSTSGPATSTFPHSSSRSTGCATTTGSR